jgi:general secretion pathway protein M
MNLNEIRRNFSENTIFYLKGIAILIVLGLFIAITYNMTNKKEQLVSLKKEELASLYNLKKEYLKESSSIAHLEKRLLSPQVGGSTGAIIEKIGARIGIKYKMISFRSAEEAVVKGYDQRGVEIKLEGLTLNQLVNLLYRIKNHRNLLLVKDFAMKGDFENPDLLDVTLQITLITKRI